jgi:hypothetical protein
MAVFCLLIRADSGLKELKPPREAVSNQRSAISKNEEPIAEG